MLLAAAAILLLSCATPSAAADSPGGGGGPSEGEVFRRLFAQKRLEQLAAVQQLLALDADKQDTLVGTMMDKMKGVLQRSRMQLEASGFSGGDEDFPDNEVTRTALAHVMENTCFLGDVLLRLPDAVHPRLSADGEWGALFRWCLSFVEGSGLTDESTDKLLGLVAQEAGLRERDPNYRNPYRRQSDKQRQKRFEEPPPKKKKERKKLQRGPRMTKSEL